MNRKEFLAAIGSLVTLPLDIIPPYRVFRMPKTFALCFGESSARIFTHLVFYSKCPSLLPMIVEREKSVQPILKPMGQQMVTIISRLDDPLLTRALPVIKDIPTEMKVRVTGLFIYPTVGVDDLSSTIIANCNLRIAFTTLDHIRVVNLPDYDGDKPQWPLQFYDDKMTDPEKQIVWELLRCYQPETRWDYDNTYLPHTR